MIKIVKKKKVKEKPCIIQPLCVCWAVTCRYTRAWDCVSDLTCSCVTCVFLAARRERCCVCVCVWALSDEWKKKFFFCCCWPFTLFECWDSVSGRIIQYGDLIFCVVGMECWWGGRQDMRREGCDEAACFDVLCVFWEWRSSSADGDFFLGENQRILVRFTHVTWSLVDAESCR